MGNKKPASLSPKVERRIEEIEGMNLDEVQALTAHMMSEILKGDVTTREATAIDRAVGQRLKAIEQELRGA